MGSRRTIWLALALTACAGSAVTACAGDDESAAPGEVDLGTPDGAGSTPVAEADATTGVRDSGADRAVPVDTGTKDTGRDAPADSTLADATPDADAATLGDALTPSDAQLDAVLDAMLDAGAADAGFADPGAPCATSQVIQRRPCGYCGTEARLCSAGADGGLIWQDWGECRGQVTSDAGCYPGTTRNLPCGLCGVQQQTCQNDCSWAANFCNQPSSAVCAPDAGDYQAGLSCDAGGRIRYCRADCTYGQFSECFDPSRVDGGGVPSGATAISLLTSAGANKVTLARSMPASPQIDRLGVAACPNAAPTSGTPRSYDYVVIANPDTARTAKVSVWSHQATGGPVLDTIMAAYEARVLVPQTVAERTACSKGVRDNCLSSNANDPTACLSDWAGLVNANAGADDRVVLGPGQAAVIYVTGYFASDTGDYQLTIRTDSLQ